MVACAARKVTPWWPAGVVKSLSRRFSPLNSRLPQLIETTDTPGSSAAVTAPVNRLLRSRVTFDEVDVRPGGDGVRPFHVEGFLHLPVTVACRARPDPCRADSWCWPFWLYLVKLGGLGKPNAWSNSARSLVLKLGAVLSTKLDRRRHRQWRWSGPRHPLPLPPKLIPLTP